MKFISYLFNYQRCPSCKETSLLLFYKFFSISFSTIVNTISVFLACFSCLSFLLFFLDVFCYLLIHCLLSHNPQFFLRLQHGFENNRFMVLFHWSFLHANVAMTINCDTPMLMPIELNF
jgi:hypothetical protein